MKQLVWYKWKVHLVCVGEVVVGVVDIYEVCLVQCVQTSLGVELLAVRFVWLGYLRKTEIIGNWEKLRNRARFSRAKTGLGEKRGAKG